MPNLVHAIVSIFNIRGGEVIPRRGEASLRGRLSPSTAKGGETPHLGQFISRQVVACWIIVIFLAACFPLPSFLSAPSIEVGAAAPDFTLQDLAGGSISLRDLRGHIVLLNFWATWCGPCKAEMPLIQERYNRGDFAVLAIDFDESRDKVQAFADDLGLDIPILLDPGGKIQELYRVRGYPTSIFVDKDGVIRVIHIGEMSASELDSYLAQLVD